MSSDAVNSPSHYMLLPGVEVIDVRRAILDKIESSRSDDDSCPTYYQVDCWSRSWEYLTRCWAKNGLEDLKKSLKYLEWLIEDIEKQMKDRKAT